MKPSSSRGAAYAANRRKTFHSTLCHLLQSQFPGFFGPDITTLLADKIHELYERCHQPLSRVKSGQVLWLAVAADERPSRQKRIQDTRLVPVLLDLVTSQDIDDTSVPGKRPQTLTNKVIRLFQQAFDQRAVLTEADVALLLHVSDSVVSHVVRTYESATTHSVPRRGTLHDLGRSVSHKAIICYKRLVEKKSTSQVAEETFHSPEEVEYYVQCCRRVQLCAASAMSVEEIAQATGHTVYLIKEYLELLKQWDLFPAPNNRRKDSVQPNES